MSKCMDEGRQFPSPCRDGMEGINLQGTFLWAFNIHPPLLRVGRNCCMYSCFILHRYLGRVWCMAWNSEEKKADGPWRPCTVLCVTCQLWPSSWEPSALGFLTLHVRSTSPDRDPSKREQEKFPVFSSTPGKVDTRKEELDFAIEILEPFHLVGLSGVSFVFAMEQTKEKKRGKFAHHHEFVE